MYDDQELLSQTFDAHTHVDVDSVDILTRADGIARTRRRQRWVVQATGASLMTAGLVAGGLALPGLFSGSTVHGHTAHIGPAADPGGDGNYTNQQEYTAFFDAGYQYQDAQQLAQLWKESDINKVKADAGLRLLDGETLPVAPTGQPAPPEDKAVEAFFNAGYSYDDAVTLAGMWNESTSQAKIDAGKKIENGEPLPIQPSPQSSSDNATNPTTVSAKRLAQAKAQGMLIVRKGLIVNKKGLATATPSGATTDDGSTPALDAYFAAGYNYDDAVSLGKIWNESNITQIKSEAGQKLIDGDQLPVQPSSTPIPADNPAHDQAMTAFFNAGYTYQDAVKLGNMWNVSSYHAKIEGGKKIENGQSLPIQP
jgi:hypothetical protein